MNWDSGMGVSLTSRGEGKSALPHTELLTHRQERCASRVKSMGLCEGTREERETGKLNHTAVYLKQVKLFLSMLLKWKPKLHR